MKTKIINSIVLFLLLQFFIVIEKSYSQTANWIWAKAAGGTSDDAGLSVAVDTGGNIYVTGLFNQSITFGTTLLTSAGSNDMYLVKYSPGGTVIWARSAGGLSYDAGLAVTTDNAGNVFVTGSFGSTNITFGAFTLANSSSNQDMFVVKYGSNGNVIWAHSAGGNGKDEGLGVATDINGNVFDRLF